MDVFPVPLPLADNRDLLVDDVVGRHRVTRNEQNENVALPQFLVDFLVPSSAAPHVPVDPEFDETVLYCWLQETENKGQPLDLALDRLSGSSACA